MVFIFEFLFFKYCSWEFLDCEILFFPKVNVLPVFMLKFYSYSFYFLSQVLFKKLMNFLRFMYHFSGKSLGPHSS